MTHVSEQIFDILKLTIKKNGIASFVVSGGSSPIKIFNELSFMDLDWTCLLYTSPSPRDRQKSRMPSSA